MTQKKKLLITRPRHDSVVEYFHFWSVEIIGSAKEHNLIVLDCEAQEANKEKVTQYLEKQSPELVIFNGHGNPATICGHKNQELIISGQNDALLKSKIVYAVSCKAAAELGKGLCKKGAKAFIGYEQDFGFVIDPTREGCPHKDKFSEPFKKASNTVALSLVKGNNAGIAFEKSQKAFEELIKQHSTTEANKEDKEIRFWLFWDKIFQKLIGDKEATI